MRSPRLRNILIGAAIVGAALFSPLHVSNADVASDHDAMVALATAQGNVYKPGSDQGKAWAAFLASLNAGGTPTTTTQPPATTTTVPPTTTTKPPVTSRNVTLWPFAQSSPWNMPRGDGATFAEGITGGTPWINYYSYSVNVFYAKASDPWVTVAAPWAVGSNPGPVTLQMPTNTTAPGGSDGHVVIVAPDGVTAHEFWVLDPVGLTCGVWIDTDLRASGWGQGWLRAAGVGASGGLVRKEEVAAGKIPHALAIAMPGGLYSPVSDVVWPAISADHTGEGTLFSIPSGVAKPSGLSALGSAMWDAAKNYGVYDVDTTGGGAVSFFVEPTADNTKVSPAFSDVGKIIAALRRVTNSTQSNVGGPGTRLAPLAPAV